MRKWLGGFVFVLGLGLLVQSCAHVPERNPERAELHLRLGTSFITRGDYHRALRELLRAEELNPDSKHVQNNLGLTYYFLKKYELALTHINHAIRLDPTFTEAKNNRGRFLIELGRHDEAIAQLEEVLADLTYPSPEYARLNIGIAQFRKKNYRAALPQLQEAVRLQRNSCLGHYYYARSLYELKNHKAAQPVFERAVRYCQGQSFDEAHFYSGLNLLKMGQKTQAKARLEEVLSLYPTGENRENAQKVLDKIR